MAKEPTFTEATPPQSGFVRAEQGAALLEKQRSMNRSKRPGFMAPAIQELSRQSQLYIFNVGPKLLEGSGASYGTMMIQPCLPADAIAPADYKGKPGEYSAPLLVPGLPYEHYDTGGTRMETQFHGEDGIEDPGYDFACQVVLGFTDAKGNFNGKFLPRARSLEKFGVGISRTWPPSKDDIALARKKMMAEYLALVQEANEAHALGKFASIRTDDHYIAARALGKTVTECRWLEFSAEAPVAAKETKACPECGEEILAVARKCKHCGSVIEKKAG